MEARHSVHRETSERKIVALGGRFGFAWITGLFFLISLVGHWLFGWFAYVNEQHAHGEPIQVSGYFVEMTRDTLENWQSEFLQRARVRGWPSSCTSARLNRRRATNARKPSWMRYCDGSTRRMQTR